jgi:GTP-binding protein
LKVDSFLREMDPGVTLLTVQTFSSLKKQGLPELEAQLNRWLSDDVSKA